MVTAVATISAMRLRRHSGAEQRGARQQRKGIIAGKTIAPDMMAGIGLFETIPRTRGLWGDAPNTAPRRSRKAASVGFNWRF